LEDLTITVGKQKLEDDPRMKNIAGIISDWESRKDILEYEYRALMKDIENIMSLILIFY
jgi:hypothetical protein